MTADKNKPLKMHGKKPVVDQRAELQIPLSFGVASGIAPAGMHTGDSSSGITGHPVPQSLGWFFGYYNPFSLY